MSDKNLQPDREIGAVACIGAGAMGEALVAGMLRAGLVLPAAVSIADADAKRLYDLGDALGVGTATNAEAAARADTIIVAVKPEFVPDVLQEIAPVLRADALIISIAAGVSVASIEAQLPTGVAVVRAMPNTPALIGAGATALAGGTAARDDDVEVARRVFAAVGEAVVVPEPLLDAVTGLSGSGPAYVYVMIEALADGGVLAGLPRDVAQRLAAQTVLGGARMVLETERHPGRLKDMVTSPGGTTIAGVATLEDHGVRAAFMRAVTAAAERSKQLGRGQEDGPL